MMLYLAFMIGVVVGVVISCICMRRLWCGTFMIDFSSVEKDEFVVKFNKSAEDLAVRKFILLDVDANMDFSQK